jgi:hypothetical protein
MRTKILLVMLLALALNAIPKLVYGSRWVIPEPHDADDLVSIVQNSLAVPGPAPNGIEKRQRRLSGFDSNGLILQVHTEITQSIQ